MPLRLPSPSRRATLAPIDAAVSAHETQKFGVCRTTEGF
jgi:hypothetical protein